MAEIKQEDVKKIVEKELKRNIYDEDAVIAPYKDFDIGELSDDIAAKIYTFFNKNKDE